MSRPDHSVRWEPKLGLTPRGHLSIGSKAEHKSSDYIFPRTQSMTTRQMEWEKRQEPVEGWGKAALGIVLWAVFGVSATFLAWVVTL